MTARRPSKARGKGRARRATAAAGPRRARLQLRHIDTWSALKISLVLSIALFFIWMVAVGVLYGVLNALGVFDTLNDLFGQLGSASGNEATGDVITPGVVFGGAAVIGAINIVLLTALCTVGHVHLQPLLRPRRRPRAHAVRARLSDEPLPAVDHASTDRYAVRGSRACSSDG